MLDEKKAFMIEYLSGKNSECKNIINRISLSAREKDSRTIYEHNLKKENIAALNIWECDGVLSVEVVETWPAFKCRKTIEFYENEKFFRVAFELSFTREASMMGVWFSVSTSSSADYMICGSSDKFLPVKGIIQKKDKWMAFDRATENRCFGFFYGPLDTGLVVMCPDRKSWMEISPRSFMCNRAGGGFSLELGKCLKQDLKKGETVCFDFFIEPVCCKIQDFEKEAESSYKFFFPEKNGQ